MQGSRSLLSIFCGLSAFSITTSSFALEMSVPDGWYAEGNVGIAHLSNGPSGSTTNSGATYNINLGYKIMPYAAVEGGYTNYKDTKIVFNGINYASVSHYSFDLAAKGILPIADSGFEAFAKLGVNHMRAKASSTNEIVTVSVNPLVTVDTSSASSSASSTGIYLGLGAQINILSEMAIVAQWQRAQGNNNTGNEDLFSLGVAFIFV